MSARLEGPCLAQELRDPILVNIVNNSVSDNGHAGLHL